MSYKFFASIFINKRLLGCISQAVVRLYIFPFYGKQVNRKDFTCALSKSMLMLMFASV